MPFRSLIVLLCVLALGLPAAAAASMKMTIGAAEDEGRNADFNVATDKVALAKAAGFEALRVSAIWTPGQRKVPADQLAAVQSVANAGYDQGVAIYATIMPFGSRTTPLTDTARSQFAAWAADLVRRTPRIRNVIIGNEPNINRYWLPQFGPGGDDVAAQQYELLLARTYDAVKAVDRKTFIIGGSVSPHGSDDPTASRQTHSPTAFITDLGAAYRATGRKKPIMDGFAFHPYGDNSSSPPTATHPRSTSIGLADYDKLVGLLGAAFDGTAQRGSTLPIIYDEYGVESQVPAAKRSEYTGREPTTTKPVPETTQGDYYDQALQIAACQPNVRAMFLFHVTDETDLNRWQSGVYYPDGTPKPSRAVVKQTIQQVRAGAVDCTETGIGANEWTMLPDVPRQTPRPAKNRPAAKKKDVVDGIWQLLGG